MGQQPVKALTERSKSGKTIKASGKSKEAEKSEFHIATGKIENRFEDLFQFRIGCFWNLINLKH